MAVKKCVVLQVNDASVSLRLVLFVSKVRVPPLWLAVLADGRLVRGPTFSFLATAIGQEGEVRSLGVQKTCLVLQENWFRAPAPPLLVAAPIGGAAQAVVAAGGPAAGMAAGVVAVGAASAVAAALGPAAAEVAAGVAAAGEAMMLNDR